MWEVLVRRELGPLLDAIRGKKAGFAEFVKSLEQDPCQEFSSPDGGTRPLAYRLTGELQPKVCGAHLKGPYRVAFSMRPPDHEDIDGIVDVLYIGERDTRNRARDVWTIVHDLFGVENPPAGHERPSCCEGGRPEISVEELHEFMRRLRKFLG